MIVGCKLLKQAKMLTFVDEYKDIGHTCNSHSSKTKPLVKYQFLFNTLMNKYQA